MLRIVSHIENLLLSHDCVIVPGIGGFVTHFEEAFFSQDSSEIFPPYCSVSFNAHLSDKEDRYGVLAQSYMTAYDINYPKALSLVSEDVAEMREMLRKNMELQIGTIGTLQLTLNYSLLFTPSDECGIFAKELYGLVQSELPKAKDAGNKSGAGRDTSMGRQSLAKDEGERPAKLRIDGEPDTKQGKNTSPIIGHDKDNTHYIIRISKNAVRYTATAIAAALIYVAFTIAPATEPLLGTGMQEAGIVNVPKRYKTASPLPVKKDNISARPSNGDNAASAPLDDGKMEQYPYTLVLASAVSEKGAKGLVENLKDEGFTEAKVIDDDGMIRVIYSSYPSDDDAYSAIRQLRTQHKSFRSAWVMKTGD